MAKGLRKDESKITYQVIDNEDYLINTRRNGDELRLRYMSWNGRDAKYDIRPWSKREDGEEKCGKGLTLTGEELEALYNKIGELMKED